MELLKEIASVSGKGGLFKILKPTRSGVILETLDDKKTKLVANTNERVSILKEISIYTTGEDSSKPLEEVLKSLHKKFGLTLKVSSKASDAELRAFMEEVVPNYDPERVYCSDIKKLITWYGILATNFTAIFDDAPKTIEAKEVESQVGEEKPKAKPKTKVSPESKESEEKAPKAKAASKPKEAKK